MDSWMEITKKKKLQQLPAKKKKGENVVFDHEVEEVGTKQEEEKINIAQVQGK